MVDTIYLIRHCEAEGNVYRRAHGHYDGHPMINGLAQCRALARRFADVPLTAVYASDLLRAKTTASYLAASRGLAVRTDPRFREINLGIWEDMAWGELVRDHAGAYEVFNETLWAHTIEGGETIHETGARMLDGLRDAARAHDGAVAVVSHGMALRKTVGLLMGLPVDVHDGLRHGDNTAVTKINVARDGAMTVEYYADNGHLGELSTIAKQNWWREGNVRDAELCFDPVDLPRENELVERFRKEAWLSVYHSMDKYYPDKTAAETTRCARQHPRSAVIVRSDEDAIGLVLLDTAYKADEGVGHISLITLDKTCRGKGLGIQLIGHAVSVYRALGRTKLHLRVADNNERAIRLYKRLGFEQTRVEQAELRPLIVMEKPLAWDGDWAACHA